MNVKKELVRKRAIKLRLRKKRYPVISEILEEEFDYKITIKTLKRWFEKFMKEDDWDLKDKSTKPNKIYYKFTDEDKKEVINLRKLTGWDSKRISKILRKKGIFMSKSYVELIIRNANLQKHSKMKGKRLKWVRWQRKHPNSLWQLDGSGDEERGWLLPVIDDCSRYCLGIAIIESMTAKAVTRFLESLIKIHGKPREILTDNGPEFRDQFDKWCERQGIKHIRSAFHKPTTVGKVERFHQTIDKELPYCYNDLEYFRFRYNHYRPHWSLNLQTPAEVYFAFHKLF